MMRLSFSVHRNTEFETEKNMVEFRFSFKLLLFISIGTHPTVEIFSAIKYNMMSLLRYSAIPQWMITISRTYFCFVELSSVNWVDSIRCQMAFKRFLTSILFLQSKNLNSIYICVCINLDWCQCVATIKFSYGKVHCIISHILYILVIHCIVIDCYCARSATAYRLYS